MTQYMKNKIPAKTKKIGTIKTHKCFFMYLVVALKISMALLIYLKEHKNKIIEIPEIIHKIIAAALR